MNVYAIYDKKAGQYFGLTVHKTDETYVRTLTPILKSDIPDNMLYHHSSDFEVFCLGTFDEKTGLIVADLRFVYNVSDLVRLLKEAEVKEAEVAQEDSDE